MGTSKNYKIQRKLVSPWLHKTSCCVLLQIFHWCLVKPIFSVGCYQLQKHCAQSPVVEAVNRVIQIVPIHCGTLSWCQLMKFEQNILRLSLNLLELRHEPYMYSKFQLHGTKFRNNWKYKKNSKFQIKSKFLCKPLLSTFHTQLLS